MTEATKDFLETEEPFALFGAWMAEAEKAEINDPNAMSVATMDADGLPDVRIVLLKGFDDTGFVFYTNEGSAKGQQLKEHPKAAMCLHWKSLRRQIRARGAVTPVSMAEADDYFATRSRASQIGAWSSQQSRPFQGKDDLREAVDRNTERFADGEVPRPDYWKGFRIEPLQIEFWLDQPYRLHDRIVFSRSCPDAPWTKQRLFP